MLLVGFDPGGLRAFGWAVLRAADDGSKDLSGLAFVCGGVCSSAEEAVRHAAERLSEPPAAIGIDAPLFWSRAGDRRADVHIRRRVCRHGGHGGTVGHVNSLRGACLVGGLLAAVSSRERWPRARVTESHPKAMRVVSAAARAFADTPALRGDGDHLRDAALGAFAAAALAVNASGWSDLAELEPEPIFPFRERVAYWFPDAD